MEPDSRGFVGVSDLQYRWFVGERNNTYRNGNVGREMSRGIYISGTVTDDINMT